MNDTQHEKGSVPRVIANYRKRQERAMRLLLAFWIGIMLLIVGTGYLIYHFMNPARAQQVSNPGETSTPETTFVQSTPTLTTVVPTSVATPDMTEIPTASFAPPEPRNSIYTVQQGDTLASIAGQFGVDLSSLTALNPLVTPEFLSVGDLLTIPAQSIGLASVTPSSNEPQSSIEYRVVSGDTLAAIAARYGSTVAAIVRENNLASPDEIRVGQTLRIPVEAGALLSATPAPTSEATGTTAAP